MKIMNISIINFAISLPIYFYYYYFSTTNEYLITTDIDISKSPQIVFPLLLLEIIFILYQHK